MEKKLNEAYEEADEIRKDSAQWKNKYKKVQVSSYSNKKKISFIINIRLKWMKLE